MKYALTYSVIGMPTYQSRIPGHFKCGSENAILCRRESQNEDNNLHIETKEYVKTSGKKSSSYEKEETKA